MKNIKLLVFGVFALSASNINAQEAPIGQKLVSVQIEQMLANNLVDLSIKIGVEEKVRSSLTLAMNNGKAVSEDTKSNETSTTTATISE